jgi:hypothetical protein
VIYSRRDLIAAARALVAFVVVMVLPPVLMAL